MPWFWDLRAYMWLGPYWHLATPCRDPRSPPAPLIRLLGWVPPALPEHLPAAGTLMWEPPAGVNLRAAVSWLADPLGPCPAREWIVNESECRWVCVP